MILKKIKKKLTYEINIHYIKIYDDSVFHSYLKNTLTHLKIIIVSNDFSNQKSINRHRMIFKCLSEIIKEKIYSITLYTYTPKEWEHQKFKKFDISNKCFKKS